MKHFQRESSDLPPVLCLKVCREDCGLHSSQERRKGNHHDPDERDREGRGLLEPELQPDQLKRKIT